jgi:hypothetical protein
MKRVLIQGMLAAAFAPSLLHAQAPGGRGATPPTAKAAAPIDLTGYWVALITEDWRYRMMVPARGDFPNVPLTPEGRRVANAWDPAKDEASGNQCAPYGAGGITRMAGRLHITWKDDNTLQVDADTGTQTRLFHFGDAVNNTSLGNENTWQGDSLAHWLFAGPGGRAANRRGGSLEVVTTHAKPGYLQRNGVPYSANAVITERYDVVHEDNGDQYLIVTTLINDPLYLARPFLRSTHFRKQADGAGWDPTPCAVR